MHHDSKRQRRLPQSLSSWRHWSSVAASMHFRGLDALLPGDKPALGCCRQQGSGTMRTHTHTKIHTQRVLTALWPPRQTMRELWPCCTVRSRIGPVFYAEGVSSETAKASLRVCAKPRRLAACTCFMWLPRTRARTHRIFRSRQSAKSLNAGTTGLATTLYFGYYKRFWVHFQAARLNTSARPKDRTSSSSKAPLEWC